MSAPRWVARSLALTAAFVAVALSLSGCVALAGEAATQLAHAHNQNLGTQLRPGGKPVAGDCWRSAFATADEYADFGTAKPVACSKLHQLYTLAVTRLAGRFTGSEWNSSHHLKSGVRSAQLKACLSARRSDLPIDPLNESRLFFTNFVPDSAQWAAGARWVRCDIGLIAYGSKYDRPAFQNLPSIASIRHSIQTNPETFEHCANDPQGPNAGPYSKDAVWANCEKNPEWMHVDGFLAPLDANHDYPSQAAMTAIYVDRCESVWTNATHITFAYYPTPEDWANGDEAIECWVGRK